MTALGLGAAAALLILLAVLAWRRARARRRSTVHAGVSEQQARENAAPLTTAIVSESRAHERTRQIER
jgi:Flp pilus assembly protein TadB